MPSINLTEDIFYRLEQEERVSEGGLIELASTQLELLNKRERQVNQSNEGDSREFTMLFLECNDILLGPKPEGENIKGNLGYNVTSTIVETCSRSGELFVDSYKNNHTNENMIYSGNMTFIEIRMDINTTLEYCFPYDCSLFTTNDPGEQMISRTLTQAMIRIPTAVLQSQTNDGIYNIGIGTIFDMSYASMPDFFWGEEMEFKNNSTLIPTTLDYGLVGMEVTNTPEGNEIQISFKLNEDQVNN